MYEIKGGKVVDYRKYVAEKAPFKWPYPVNYGKETREDCDVLIIGGGLGGAFAAIHVLMYAVATS